MAVKDQNTKEGVLSCHSSPKHTHTHTHNPHNYLLNVWHLSSSSCPCSFLSPHVVSCCCLYPLFPCSFLSEHDCCFFLSSSVSWAKKGNSLTKFLGPGGNGDGEFCSFCKTFGFTGTSTWLQLWWLWEREREKHRHTHRQEDFVYWANWKTGFSNKASNSKKTCSTALLTSLCCTGKKDPLLPLHMIFFTTSLWRTLTSSQGICGLWSTSS